MFYSSAKINKYSHFSIFKRSNQLIIDLTIDKTIETVPANRNTS